MTSKYKISSLAHESIPCNVMQTYTLRQLFRVQFYYAYVHDIHVFQVIYCTSLPDLKFHVASAHFIEHIQSLGLNHTIPGLHRVKGLIAAYIIWHNHSMSKSHPHRICNFLHTQLQLRLEHGRSIQPIEIIQSPSPYQLS